MTLSMGFPVVCSRLAKELGDRHQNNLSRGAQHGSLAMPSVPGFYILNLVENDVEDGEGAADVLLQAGTAS
jgi:hypothetical protein